VKKYFFNIHGGRHAEKIIEATQYHTALYRLSYGLKDEDAMRLNIHLIGVVKIRKFAPVSASHTAQTEMTP